MGARVGDVLRAAATSPVPQRGAARLGWRCPAVQRRGARADAFRTDGRVRRWFEPSDAAIEHPYRHPLFAIDRDDRHLRVDPASVGIGQPEDEGKHEPRGEARFARSDGGDRHWLRSGRSGARFSGSRTPVPHGLEARDFGGRLGAQLHRSSRRRGSVADCGSDSPVMTRSETADSSTNPAGARRHPRRRGLEPHES